MNEPRADTVDCIASLNAWNLFGDVAGSVGVDLGDRDDEAFAVYDKLFWGNNLPSVTPAGCHYEPEWSAKEIMLLYSILRSGLELFRERMRPQ